MKFHFIDSFVYSVIFEFFIQVVGGNLFIVYNYICTRLIILYYVTDYF